MSVLRNLATGVTALVSVVGMSSLAGPAQAAPATEVSAVPATARAGCSASWKSAVGLPTRWTTIRDNTCSVFGYPAYKAVYEWRAERGRPCVQVLGFVNGRDKWVNAGCGRSGVIRNVPWGNVAANKTIKIKGASLVKWR
ncbi:hypothetical protein ACIPQJ_29230 [Streptomyces sp. NPDC090082]|uniref:hypothetical protein n=1 Tax=unclassified Streptomyces TaxID=2593676 RepID=UPI003803FAFF